jgi:hypothetical protein
VLRVEWDAGATGGTTGVMDAGASRGVFGVVGAVWGVAEFTGAT